MANNLAGANSETSAIGTNSDTAIVGGNWVADTYTGQAEQNDFQYVAVSCQTDEAGTLFFDFSVDGTNWTTFPVAGFDISPNIHEYHSAHKAARFFRARFVGTGGRTYFRLYTYYTNTQVQLNSVLRQDISTDSDSNTVKAVAAGEVQNADGTGTGTVSVAQLTPERAQVVDMPNVTIYQDSSEISGSLPSGPLPTYTPAAPIVAANVIDTFWMDKRLLNVAASRFYADIPGVFVFIADASDALGNNSNTTGFTFPTLTSVAGIGRNVKARVFQDFVRIIIINTTGSTMSQWAFRMKGNNSESGDISISGDELILTSFPMTLGQNLIRGESDDGTTLTYPAQVHRDTSTGAVSLAVVQGARISEAFGKQHVQATQSAAGTITPVTLNLYTVPSGFRFWLTSIEVTLTNELSTGGVLAVTDDGVNVRQYAIPSGTNQTTGTTNITIDYTEPVLFETDVEFNVPATGLGSNVAVNITGYSEPI